MLTFLVKKTENEALWCLFFEKKFKSNLVFGYFHNWLHILLHHAWVSHSHVILWRKKLVFFSNFVSIANLLWIPSDIKRILFRAAPVWKFQCQNCRRGNIPLMSFPGINQPILYFTFLAFKETLLFV